MKRTLFGALGVAISLMVGQGSAFAGPFVIGGTTYVETGPTELLNVLFNDANGAPTTGTYDGLVLVTVSGVGRSLGTALNDAFYVYTDGAGTPIVPFHDAQFYQLAFDSVPLVPLNFSRDAKNFIVYDVATSTDVSGPPPKS